MIKEVDSKFKAWQLACALFNYAKVIQSAFLLNDNQIKNSEPFDRVGTDQRTKDKYFSLMVKYNYIVLKEDKWFIPDNIKEMKPKSLGEYIKELEAQANGKPIPQQKTLGAQP